MKIGTNKQLYSFDELSAEARASARKYITMLSDLCLDLTEEQIEEYLRRMTFTKDGEYAGREY